MSFKVEKVEDVPGTVIKVGIALTKLIAHEFHSGTRKCIGFGIKDVDVDTSDVPTLSIERVSVDLAMATMNTDSPAELYHSLTSLMTEFENHSFFYFSELDKANVIICMHGVTFMYSVKMAKDDEKMEMWSGDIAKISGTGEIELESLPGYAIQLTIPEKEMTMHTAGDLTGNATLYVGQASGTIH